MPYRITDDCIACGACEPECPTRAISEGTEIYVIEAARCNDCEGLSERPQCAAVCPVEACVPR